MLISDTLTEIENWYQDCSGDPLKPKLLCKLAFIEFCGWIEEWMDAAIRELDQYTVVDLDWTEKEVISRTSGFDYNKHFRPMACRLLGETRVRKAEVEYERKTIYDVEQLKSELGGYWAKRCDYAHQDFSAHALAQLKFDAPSWTKNKQRVLEKKLNQLKLELIANC